MNIAGRLVKLERRAAAAQQPTAKVFILHCGAPDFEAQLAAAQACPDLRIILTIGNR